MRREMSLFLLLVVSGFSFAQSPCEKAFVKVLPKAPLLIVSGPSGAGKTTVLKRVIQESPRPVRTAVAVTTRAPRPGENDGEAYHFWTKEKFEKAKANGEFLEWAEVHGNFYGTLRSEVDSYRQKGTAVVLVIDVQGAKTINKTYPESVMIFLKTSSPKLFEERLRARGTETEEAIQKRLTSAKKELQFEKDYAHTVINDDLETAVKELQNVLQTSF